MLSRDAESGKKRCAYAFPELDQAKPVLDRATCVKAATPNGPLFARNVPVYSKRLGKSVFGTVSAFCLG